jgi:hypothetical protein
MVHCILPDPVDSNRIYTGISVAGCFRSDDDGATWRPLNKGVLADFQPQKYPEVGQCVHSMHLSSSRPDWLFQQNHCGVYRSQNAAEDWTDISKGLPSRFGFASVLDPHQPETFYVVSEISPERRYVCDSALTVYRTRDAESRGESSPRDCRRRMSIHRCYATRLQWTIATTPASMSAQPAVPSSIPTMAALPGKFWPSTCLRSCRWRRPWCECLSFYHLAGWFRS